MHRVLGGGLVPGNSFLPQEEQQEAKVTGSISDSGTGEKARESGKEAF